MKNKITFLLSFILLLSSSIFAQNPIATLQHNGSATVFHGTKAFLLAHSAAVDKDTIYLSTGIFNGPYISKGITIIGASGDLDNKNATIANLTLDNGCDSLKVIGVCLLSVGKSINQNTSVNDIHFENCSLERVYAGSIYGHVNRAIFNRCVFYTAPDFDGKWINLTIKNSVFAGDLYGFAENTLFENNIVHGTLSIAVSGSIFRNNIFESTTGQGCVINEGNLGNVFMNNVFEGDTVDFSGNTIDGNYVIPSVDSIFQTDSYYLKDSTYLGTDGTVVGIYGGSTPFNDEMTAPIPLILEQEVATETDENGDLKIKFTVKAQEN